MPIKETIFETKWIGIYRYGNWDFVHRPQSPLAVGIIAITSQNEIILVEQFRHPLQTYTIELPAGIIGDEPEHLGETFEETARRELLEETGYAAGEMKLLMKVPTSAGMSSEYMYLFHAIDISRRQAGGGVGNENIKIHHVKLTDLRHWIAEQVAQGKDIDGRIFTALWAAEMQ